MSTRVDVLVAAAYPPELADLRDLLGEGLRARIADLDVVAKAVGVGLPNAAGGTVARIETLRPRAVVLTGTCGALPSGPLAIGDAVIASRIHLVAGDVVDRRAEFPAPMSIALESHPLLSAALAGATPELRAADIATTLAVTTDDALAARMGQATGCAVEHLEAFGVAASCSSYGIPFAAVLGVANVVGSSGRAQWAKNHRTAGAAAARAIVAWLSLGCPGLVRTS